MILADENIDTSLVRALRQNNIEEFYIKDDYKGISDKEVIRLSKTPPRIILTEDKDFGEWVMPIKKEILVLFYCDIVLRILVKLLRC